MNLNQNRLHADGEFVLIQTKLQAQKETKGGVLIPGEAGAAPRPIGIIVSAGPASDTRKGQWAKYNPIHSAVVGSKDGLVLLHRQAIDYVAESRKELTKLLPYD